MSLRALIIDDEPRARLLLKAIIEDISPSTQILELCEDLPAGIKAIQKHQPDLIFLDIEMPGYSGLQILDFFEPSQVKFEIVFVTAYSEYALQAFRLSAIDYLLKPLQPELVKEAIDKVSNRVKQNQPGNSEPWLDLLKQNLDNQADKKISIPVGSGYKFISIKDLLVLKADGSYTEIILTTGNKFIASKHLKFYEDLLTDFPMFYRAHKSNLINLDHVEEVTKVDGGSVIMKNGLKCQLSQEKVNDLLFRLNLRFS